MPPKIRELKQVLRQAGFRELARRGKGSHTIWGHPAVAMLVVVAGQDGDDAKPYQVRLVTQALDALNKEER